MKRNFLSFFQRLENPIVKYGKYVILSVILLLAFWARVQIVSEIPEEQFAGNDPYLYYWQAKIISEQGGLPERDMHRWLPVGRNLNQTLNLYSYALAYAHKVLLLLFPRLSLHQITLYMPAICFLLSLVALYYFFYHTHGLMFASIVGILLATFPGTVDRSIAGFSDRDSWCLMLGILTVITYLFSLQAQQRHRRLLWTLASGVFVILGGHSWEGFGVFLSVIVVVELWNFITSETEHNLSYYFLWVCIFVPTLYLTSPAYRIGGGFSTHILALMLVQPIVLLCIRVIRQLLISKISKLRPHARTAALGLSIMCIVVVISYVFIQSSTFANTTVPFSQNKLMQSISELYAMTFNDWLYRYGNMFVVASIGMIGAVVTLWKKYGTLFTFPIILFYLSTFLQDFLDRHLGYRFTYNLFLISVISIILLGLMTAYRKKTTVKNEPTIIAGISWFFFWGTLARDAARYDFFMGIPIAYFFTYILIVFAEYITEKLRHPEYITEKFMNTFSHTRLRTAITVSVFITLFFWIPHGNHIKTVASQTRTIYPDKPEIRETFQWIKTQLLPSAVIATDWTYGSQLNVLAGVKTVIDQDHYIQHWIHLYYRYILGQSYKEALQFLKTHKATHLMLNAESLIFGVDTHSNIGSDENGDIKFSITPMYRQLPTDMKYRMAPNPNANIPLEFIDFNIGSESKLSVKAQLKTGEIVNLPAVALINKQRITANYNNEHGGTLIVFDEYQQPTLAYYIPAIGWDSLAIRLYFRGDLSDIFVPVYPADKNPAADVKIWEIRYPPNIKTNPKYLAMEPE